MSILISHPLVHPFEVRMVPDLFSFLVSLECGWVTYLSSLSSLGSEVGYLIYPFSHASPSQYWDGFLDLFDLCFSLAPFGYGKQGMATSLNETGLLVMKLSFQFLSRVRK